MAETDIATSRRRLLVSAFGINSGGGLTLLLALARGIRPHVRAILLDERMHGREPTFDDEVGTTYVRRSFRDRLQSMSRLLAMARGDDVVLCFNSLPPLRKVAARVVTYVQAPHFVGAHRGIRYSLRTTIRMFLERVWFRMGVVNCDELWVQTESMADAIRAAHPGANVSVVPLIDDDLLQKLQTSAPAGSMASAELGSLTFFYPADIVGHKNHATLLRAWRILASEGPAPRLHLTISPSELDALLAGLAIRRDELASVVALGTLPRAAVMERLQASSALIFPSMAETFGLPLLEATALNVPILAAERDFVRDVAQPRETFDPTSARSIARAVVRFANAATQRRPEYFPADRFVERLLA